MTLYLWHMTVMVLMIGLGNLLGGLGLGLQPGSGTWWMTRPIWIAILAAVLSLFLAVFGRFEQIARKGMTAPLPTWRVIGGAIGICSGLAILALQGIWAEGILGIRAGVVSMVLAGAWLALGMPLRRETT
jgi:hypothetical protein